MTSVAATLWLLAISEAIRKWANPSLRSDEMLLGLVLAKPGFSSRVCCSKPSPGGPLLIPAGEPFSSGPCGVVYLWGKAGASSVWGMESMGCRVPLVWERAVQMRH